MKHLEGLYEVFQSFDVVGEYEGVEFDDDEYMGRLKVHLETSIYPFLDSIRHESCSKKGISLYEGAGGQTNFFQSCLRL